MIDFIGMHAGTLGLLIFFLFFCGVVYWAYRPSKRKALDQYALIPLLEDEYE